MDYSTLTRQELIDLLKRRDGRTPLGIVWKRNEIDHDNALNDDFVAMDIHPELSVGIHRGRTFSSKVTISTRCDICAWPAREKLRSSRFLSTEDSILLIEVKGEPFLDMPQSVVKARAVHKLYKRVMMIHWEDRRQWRTVINDDKGDHNLLDQTFRFGLLPTS